MDSQPSVSVAMCTYNGESFLQEQLDSFVRQERQPDELVVCDDSSTDRTWEILENFARTAPFPVRLYQNEKNLGYNQNFEQCVLKCSGDIIFFSDQDDVWLPAKIRAFEEVFLQNPDVGLVFCEAKLIDASGKDLLLLLSQKNNVYLREKNIATAVAHDPIRFCLDNYGAWNGMALAFRRVYLPQLSPFQLYDLWTFRVLSSIAEIRFLPTPLVCHRLHEKNTTSPEMPAASIKVEVQQTCNPGLADYYEQASQAMESLVCRLKQFPERIRPGAIEKFQAKGEHYHRRHAIYVREIPWLWGIFAETWNGNYFRYSKGWKSIVADVVYSLRMRFWR